MEPKVKNSTEKSTVKTILSTIYSNVRLIYAKDLDNTIVIVGILGLSLLAIFTDELY